MDQEIPRETSWKDLAGERCFREWTDGVMSLHSTNQSVEDRAIQEREHPQENNLHATGPMKGRSARS